MEVWFCYYAVTKLHWKPSEYINMPRKEKIIFHAIVEKRLQDEQEQLRKLNKHNKHR